MAASTGHDLYAAGVTLSSPADAQVSLRRDRTFQHPKFGEPVPLTRWRPETPAWVENLLLKAVVATRRSVSKPPKSFAGARTGARGRLAPPLRAPLMARNPALAWRLIAAVSLALNLVLLMLLLR